MGRKMRHLKLRSKIFFILIILLMKSTLKQNKIVSFNVHTFLAPFYLFFFKFVYIIKITIIFFWKILHITGVK